MRCLIAAIPIVTLSALTPATAVDLARGAQLFQTCSACHNVLGTGIGPDLAGIYGRKAAMTPGFDYSEALRTSGLIWTEASLRAFIANPQGFVKGTRMNFPGYSNPADVDDVLAFLKTQ
jgi:cytochrome c